MRKLLVGPAAKAAGLGTLLLTLSYTVVAAGDADWRHDVTVLTVGSSGAWGAATGPHTGAAIAGAIATCRERAGPGGSGCGSRFTTIRNGWSLGFSCGDTEFIVAAGTLAAARQEFINQEIYLRQVLNIEMPPCGIIVGIGPDGRLAEPRALSEVLPIIGLHSNNR